MGWAKRWAVGASNQGPAMTMESTPVKGEEIEHLGSCFMPSACKPCPCGMGRAQLRFLLEETHFTEQVGGQEHGTSGPWAPSDIPGLKQCYRIFKKTLGKSSSGKTRSLILLFVPKRNSVSLCQV